VIQVNDRPVGTVTALTKDPVTYTVQGRDDEEPVTFKGVLLAHESAHEDEHPHNGDYAPPRWKCRACRWFEVTLYRVMDDEQPRQHMYMVHTRGMTIVPNEIIFARAAWANSPYQVLELLTQWRRGAVRSTPMIPQISQDLLDRAADHDPELSEALDRWINAGTS
jgi:hypothetical protein